MKRIVLISAAAAAMLLSFSCQKEEQTGDNHVKSEILTVTAGIEDVVSETKTYIDGTETSPKTYWSEGDSIKLFNTDGDSSVYVISNWSTKATTATFTPVGSPLTGTFACAYYPADSAKSYSDGKITANIPSSQKYVSVNVGKNAGTFAKGVSPMVGTGTPDAKKGNLDLTFKNLFGVLQLTFKSDATITTVSRIDVAGAADTAFFGMLTVTPPAKEGDNPTCDFEEPYERGRQVSLVMDTPVTLDGTNGTSFYIVLPAGVNTARIGVTTNDGLYYKDVTKSVERSHIKPLTASTLGDAGFAKAIYSEAQASAEVMIGGAIWAPVNCGYDAVDYKYGKLYQWGRKDGCGYKATDETSSYNDRGDLLQTAVSGPVSASSEETAKFYKAQQFNWLDSQNLERWNSGTEKNPAKTEYDPCPAGWRVPTGQELDALTDNTGYWDPSAGWDSAKKGYWFNGTRSPSVGKGLFLPAAGLRGGTSGNAGRRGSGGYYWSSSAYGNRAVCLHITGYDGGIGFCADGLSVRCVK